MRDQMKDTTLRNLKHQHTSKYFEHVFEEIVNFANIINIYSKI